MANDDNEVTEIMGRVQKTEAAAVEIATQHIAAHQPFAELKDGLPERDMQSFSKIAATGVVTKSEAIGLAKRDVERYVRLLRPQTVIYPHMGAVRLAVLVHVAMVITRAELSRLRPLWDAIAQSDWATAANELLLSNWPVKASSIDERRRVVELANMMRDGNAPVRAA